MADFNDPKYKEYLDKLNRIHDASTNPSGLSNEDYMAFLGKKYPQPTEPVPQPEPPAGSVFDTISRLKAGLPATTADNALSQPPAEKPLPSGMGDVKMSEWGDYLPPSDPSLNRVSPLGMGDVHQADRAFDVPKAPLAPMEEQAIPSGVSEPVDLTQMGAEAKLHPVQNLVHNPISSQEDLNKMTLDLGKQDDYKKQLQDAMERRNHMQLSADLGKALSKISSGVLGLASKSNVKDEGAEAYAPLEKAGKQGVEDVLFMKEQEKNDPNSPMSKAYKGYLERYGVKINGDISAAQVEKVLPMAAKEFELRYAKDMQEKLQGQRLESDAKLQSQRLNAQKVIADNANQLHRELAADKLAAQTAAGEKKEEKAAKDFHRKTLDKVEQYLFGSRITPEARLAKVDYYNVKKAEPFLKRANELSAPEVALFVDEVAKIAKSGVPTEGEFKHLFPKTAIGKVKELYSQISGKPKSIQAGEFIKLYGNYLMHLKGNAKSVMDKHFNDLVEINKTDLGEENYNTLKKRFYETSPGNEATADVDASSEKASSDKVKVSNGKETLMIDPADLSHAEADGYKRL